MHIADGIVPVEIAFVSAAISIYILYRSLKKVSNEDLPITAAMSALFFIASFIHIPLGPTQIHLLLLGIIGILLKDSAFLAIFVALVLQALLLGFGGVSALGVNALIMGVPALLIGYIYNKGVFNKFKEEIRYFLIGFLGVFFPSALMAFTLFISAEEYFYTALTSIAINTPAMILEGIVTIFLIRFINKTTKRFS